LLGVFHTSHRYFDRFIMACIGASSLALATASQSNKLDPGYVGLMALLNFCFFVIFTVELVGKIIAYGLVFTEFGYLRDPWNWLGRCLLCWP
jgi:hypothetical protein